MEVRTSANTFSTFLFSSLLAMIPAVLVMNTFFHIPFPVFLHWPHNPHHHDVLPSFPHSGLYCLTREKSIIKYWFYPCHFFLMFETLCQCQCFGVKFRFLNEFEISLSQVAFSYPSSRTSCHPYGPPQALLPPMSEPSVRVNSLEQPWCAWTHRGGNAAPS